MTWFTIDCVTQDGPETKEALVCLEDISSVGPVKKTASYLIDNGMGTKMEDLAHVTMRNGAAFLVRPGEAERLKELIAVVERERLGYAVPAEPEPEPKRRHRHVRYDGAPRELVPNTARGIDTCSLCGQPFNDHKDCGGQDLRANGCGGWFHVLVEEPAGPLCIFRGEWERPCEGDPRPRGYQFGSNICDAHWAVMERNLSECR